MKKFLLKFRSQVVKYNHQSHDAHRLSVIGQAGGSLLLLGCCLIAGWAQTPTRRPGTPGGARPLPATTPPPSPAEINTLSLVADTDRDYLISAGDVLAIQVEDAPELSRSYRVNAAGDITLAWIGNLSVKDQTTDALASRLAGILQQQEFLKDPIVFVNVQQFNSQTYFVQGAVNHPGVFQVEGRPSLLKLIGLAGGLNEGHGTVAFIVRRKKHPSPNPVAVSGTNNAVASSPPARTPVQAAAQEGQLASLTPLVATPLLSSSPQAESPERGDAMPVANTSLPQPVTTTAEQSTPEADSQIKNTVQAAGDKGMEDADYEMLKVNLAALYKGNFAENQRLMPGDMVNVPRADTFYVAGEVTAPGSFVLKEGTTLRQAISLAQGTTFKAKLGRGVIFRDDQTSGRRQEIPIDIGDVMSGKVEDIPIFANDVIIVPNSRVKSVGSALLTAFGVNSARVPIRY